MQVRSADSLPAALAAHIAEGLTSHTMCPTCGGGETRELSLTVYYQEPGIAKVSCWRNSCGWYSLIVGSGVKYEGSKMAKVRRFEKPTVALLEEDNHFLSETYGLRPSVMRLRGWKRVQHKPLELVMPVLGTYGEVRGTTTRTFDTPKWCDSYKQCPTEKWFDVWDTAKGKYTVLVEDQLSACKLYGMGYSAIALLGTNLSSDKCQEIRKVLLSRKAVLALDADATDKSLKLASRYAHIMPIVPMLLEEDIKAMPEDEIRKRLADYE